MCVRTTVGYSVVAEFIVESESTESISEALHILHSWNPEWNPKFWMCDYSDAEISALDCCFPDTIVYLCDFHRKHVTMETKAPFVVFCVRPQGSMGSPWVLYIGGGQNPGTCMVIGANQILP